MLLRGTRKCSHHLTHRHRLSYNTAFKKLGCPEPLVMGVFTFIPRRWEKHQNLRVACAWAYFRGFLLSDQKSRWDGLKQRSIPAGLWWFHVCYVHSRQDQACFSRGKSCCPSVEGARQSQKVKTIGSLLSHKNQVPLKKKCCRLEVKKDSFTMEISTLFVFLFLQFFSLQNASQDGCFFSSCGGPFMVLKWPASVSLHTGVFRHQ